mmetsp:Transcript_3701/g.5472  ORF Transcript_3701/g.5472 Transcript_3701/m.5472 type:complete len:444 (+) Transcript_3701:28-1359(+)
MAQQQKKEELSEEERQVEMWKIKKMIKDLTEAKGNGTSMISLIVPPEKQVSQIARMLSDEYGTASNIKSRVNRQSVLEAITSTQQRLKLYNNIPPNGLVIYCGTVMTDDNKTKKKTIDFEPFKPINTSLYLCDNKFHTEPLNELLEANDQFGFVVMDGNGCLFGTLCGNTRNVLHKISVELPKKHGRGGQSAVRFARLRLEKRHNYLRKVAELSVQFFISNDKPNVAGLILSGSADFKSELNKSDLFDPRLSNIVLKIVDVPYGGEQGFNKAIELSQEVLANVKFIKEKQVIDNFFDHVAKDTGMYVYGVDQTLRAIEMGVVDTIVVWENLEYTRYTLKHPSTEEIIYKNLNLEQAKDSSHFHDDTDDVDYLVEDEESLLEWLSITYKKYDSKIEFVTDRSQEGAQFVQGFGGMAGILRYQVNFEEVEQYLYDDDDSDLSDFM